VIDSYTSTEAINRAAENASRFFSVADERERSLRAAVAQARSASANRLVKAPKSSTDRHPGLTGAYFNRKTHGPKPVPVQLDSEAPHFSPDLKQAGTWAVVEGREWAGESRIRMETRPGCTADLPANEGDRITKMLTQRAARKISESCYFMACQRGGYSTFATLTLSAEARDKLKTRVIVPKYPVSKNGYSQFPVDAARAKQGPLGIQYQVDGETPAYNITEQHVMTGEMRHPESGALFTPMRETWAFSVQNEAGRFFDAANKMYQRGWQYRDSAGAVVKVAGSRAMYCAEAEAELVKKKGVAFTPVRYYKTRPKCPRRAYRVLKEQYAGSLPFTPLKWWREPLGYLWVAEAPNMSEKCWKKEFSRPVADEHGELLTNPHIHLLMKWRVSQKHFPAWAARLEKLWGHGFNHLEKITDPQKAGGYVAKAAGYVSKGQGQNDQGEIRGNRYGISARARAPGWIESERHQVGMMGWLLAEANEIWNKKHGEKIQRRERLKSDLDAAITKPKRKKIGELLEQVRGEIEPLAKTSKYGVIFKTPAQQTQFFDWAKRKGWTAEPQNSLWLENWRRQQWLRRNRGRLEASAGDLAAWFAMADYVAVACNDEDLNDATFYGLSVQELPALYA